jgi:hypothetical protein
MPNLNCSSITLAGICMDCQSSLGGIKRVWLTRYSDVTAVTVDPVSDNDDRDLAISAITLKADAKWYEYQFRKETGSLTSTLNVDETTGTNYVANELSLVFTKMETAKRLEIAAMSIGQVVAVVEDSNGKYWYLGLDDYVSASAGSGNTGTAKGDQNAYLITLSTDSKTYPYELTAEAVTAMKGNVANAC